NSRPPRTTTAYGPDLHQLWPESEPADRAGLPAWRRRKRHGEIRTGRGRRLGVLRPALGRATATAPRQHRATTELLRHGHVSRTARGSPAALTHAHVAR